MYRLLAPVMGIIELPFALLQKMLGHRRIAWVFLTPNLLLFAVFAFLPIVLNMAYSVTGSEHILLSERPSVGGENFSVLLSCQNYFDPNSCQRDLFWRSVWNTLFFVVLQVGFMVGFSLITAVVLNRDIRARGFFRAVFFFPVLLSPVVVALIWKWILQRFGVLNAALDSLGIGSVDWLLEANLAFGWSVFLSVWAHMGFYTLILLAGLQAIPRDVYEAAQPTRQARGGFSAGSQCRFSPRPCSWFSYCPSSRAYRPSMKSSHLPAVGRVRRRPSSFNSSIRLVLPEHPATSDWPRPLRCCLPWFSWC